MPTHQEQVQQLLNALVDVCRGHETLVTFDAAVNLVGAALSELSRDRGHSEAQALATADEISREVKLIIEKVWDDRRTTRS